MSDESAGERLTRDLRQLFGSGPDIPPPVIRAMKTEIEEWDPGRRVVMTFPTLPRYAGPTGFVQGGVIAAAFDNAFGPVAYTAASSLVVSVALSVSFVRPLAIQEEWFHVEAELVEVTRRFVFVRGEARTRNGRLVATCSSELVALEH